MAAPEYDAIVVGMGASGCMCAATLSRAGKRVLALEAMDRIGGRVNTVPFGDGIIELGAEWIHGTEGSAVYELAMQNNVSIIPQDLAFKVYRSDGSEVDANVVNDLLDFCMAAVDDPPKDPEPLGQFITKRLRTYIKTKYPQLENDTDFVDNFLKFMDSVINNYESSNSWNDITTSSAYEQLGGNQHMSWHKNGYKTLFDIILNKFNNGPGLSTLTTKLNTEVVRIKWPKDTTELVEVTTKDGTVYKAKYVIVTVSLGVLKERHSTLFSPQLPETKTSAIQNMTIGVVAKITFRFPTKWCPDTFCGFIWKSVDYDAVPVEDRWLTQMEGISVPMSCDNCGTSWLSGDSAKLEAWWPKTAAFFGFIWHSADEASVSAADKWTTRLFAVSTPKSHGKVLTVWTSGDDAKLVETLPEEEVKRKVMEVIRKFMGANITVPEPIEMIRSNWYSNPFTRGSYSYDNVLTPNFPNARKDLGQPLLDAAGTPRVLFAGEATEPNHFSTVHGALDSGRREANRLLRIGSILRIGSKL